MSAGPYVLGLDVGTTACKCVLLSPQGTSAVGESDPYPVTSPYPEWAEQDAALWRAGAAQAVARACAAAACDRSSVVAVGLTGQMHTAVLLDDHGGVLRPPLLWSDQRAVREAEAAQAQFTFQSVTLNPLLPAFTLAKLLWVRDHEPQVYRRVRHVLQPKDYLRLLLTGDLATEPSDASGTALFDARSWTWSEEIVEHFDVPRAWLPPCLPSAAVTGAVSGEGATLLGVPAGIPVVAGAGDQAAQAYGLGAVDPDVLVVQIGTSGVVLIASPRPDAGAFCHALPGRWIRLESLHSAGSSLSWIRDVVAPGVPYATLTAEAAAVAPGADGLVFLPFLVGERRGLGASVPAAYVGLRPGHQRAHLVRAVLEGVAFELRRLVDAWALPGHSPRGVRLVGGGARDVVWRGIFAGALDLPVAYSSRDSAFGAAVLAGIGVGWWSSPPPPLEADASRDGAEPTRQRYRSAYHRYRGAYDEMHKVAATTAWLE